MSTKQWRIDNQAKIRSYVKKRQGEFKLHWSSHNPYDVVGEKTCSQCKKSKPRVEFYRFLCGMDGLDSRCKDCSYRKNMNACTQRMLSKARLRAKQKGLEFNLTLADLVIPTHCPVLGIPLIYGVGKGGSLWVSPNSPSLDRKDNSKGYTRDNIHIISNRANILKSNATVPELEAILMHMRS
jgi:hypothetical protein